MVDRAQIKAGMFLTGGPPVNGQTLTKVMVGKPPEPTIDDSDDSDARFDEAARLQALLEQTRKAIAALNKPVGRGD
jgi:hypothetical protein